MGVKQATLISRKNVLNKRHIERDWQAVRQHEIIACIDVTVHGDGRGS